MKGAPKWVEGTTGRIGGNDAVSCCSKETFKAACMLNALFGSILVPIPVV